MTNNNDQVLWIAGASGLVGREALRAAILHANVSEVVSFVRRKGDASEGKLRELTVDFSTLTAAQTAEVAAPTVALCALGTTIAKAGSNAAFRAVDFDAVLHFARAAKERGARTFVVVTALGADANSLVFYNRVKGEIEEALKSLAFESLAIAQPSLLLGDRDERRVGERIAIVVSRAVGPLLRWLPSRPIEAATVGRAMVQLAMQPAPGVRVIRSGELHAIGS
ncbi:MAG: NAD(P)H-binding protein [Deltaproteobacteria bacterium]|nr:NAD(P)H-binding protein [Deltaproteobacteria bacterium]